MYILYMYENNSHKVMYLIEHTDRDGDLVQLEKQSAQKVISCLKGRRNDEEREKGGRQGRWREGRREGGRDSSAD